MRVLKWIGIVLGALVVLLFGAFQYFKSQALARYEKEYSVEVKAIPMPFPLTPREVEKLRAQKQKERDANKPAAAPADVVADVDQGAGVNTAGLEAVVRGALGADGALPTDDADAAGAPADDLLAGVDLDALAKERAIERGKRYVESRAGCTECHGGDFGGKTIIDAPVMGTWNAPNITRGGITADYKSQDWVRLIRHGIKPNGKAASMPSTDFTWFSDQEISDIAMYINSMPKVDRVMPPSTFGPIFSMLIAQGEIPVSAEIIDHTAERPRLPPRSDVVSAELGKHLATTCTGCHGPNFSGGPIQGGDPNWAPAANITFHESGLASWTLEQFIKGMREGVRPDGSTIRPPMVIAYTSKLNDEELESLYLFLKSVPPVALGVR